MQDTPLPPAWSAEATPTPVLEDLMDACAVLAMRLRATGDTASATYADAAGVSLRVAARTAAAFSGPTLARAALALPAGTFVLATGGPDRVLAMHGDAPLLRRVREDGMVRVTDLPQARRILPDLGATLVATGLATELCHGPVGSALLVDALWRWVWIHDGLRSQWRTTREGAAAIVAALDEGRQPAMLDEAAMRGRIDADVLDGLRRIGWRLHPRQLG